MSAVTNSDFDAGG